MGSEEFYIGIDVGTQSVRAGLVTKDGKILKIAAEPIKTWNPFRDVYEQSSDDIWNACVEVVNAITDGVDKALIKGIGFDATCSLVAIGEDLKPISISKTGNQAQNIILWMDHRATDEANLITKLSHPNLKFIGGCMSPEMEPPKLLWLKKNLPSQWAKAKYFFDLPDFLTWKATGSLSRSLCSLVCKWTYQAGVEGKEGWTDDFWKQIGLGDLVSDGYKKIGSLALEPGQPCGNGLIKEVADEMNLLEGTPVSTSIIDAHAGGLGMLHCSVPGRDMGSLENRMALICGTSTCHMKVNQYPILTPGVWGPYYSAMVPGMWCSEAGQSAAGALVDFVVNNNSISNELKQKLQSNRHVADILNDVLDELQKKFELPSVSLLTSDVHVWPDYHGNRSPLADPQLKGVVCGLTLSKEVESLAKQYLATLQSLAYSTRHIIQSLVETGHKIECLYMCGGLAKNPLYVQMHADITGLPVVIPDETESVLLGSALLGATAANRFPSVIEAMKAMCGSGKLIEPRLEDKSYHERKYKAFHRLLQCQKEIKEIMTLP